MQNHWDPLKLQPNTSYMEKTLVDLFSAAHFYSGETVIFLSMTGEIPSVG